MDAAGPKQNVVPLQDGRALIGVALDGASPCLTSYSFTRGLSDAERERLVSLQGPQTALRRARDAGHIMPVRFDDRPAGMTALVLVGEDVPEIESEWMARAAWRLNVPCGYLGVSAGWHLLERPDGHAWSGNDPYFRYVAVPPGEYRVELLAFLPADEVLFARKGGTARFAVPERSRRVPIGRYFRLTCPGERLPDWLRAFLIECPDEDPGHEEEWEQYEDEEDEIEVEDYLLHAIRLTPVSEGDARPRPPRDLWLPFELRMVPNCPRGIPLRGGVS